MLKETIISILSQTVQGFTLSVLDNGSTDNTAEILENFKNSGANINVYRNETNLGQEENFKKAQNLASKKWVMLFHDDDLMHPDYIKNAFLYLNKYPETVLLGAGYIEERKPENTNWQEKANKNYHFKNVNNFALALFLDYPYHFASSIYRTELFKKYFFRYDLYGKIWDRPFLTDIASHGEAVILDKNMIKYRVHAGQDSLTASTGPFLENWLALQENYHKYIVKNCSFFNYILYCIRAKDFLTIGFNGLKSEHSDISKNKFYAMAKNKGILPICAEIYGTVFRNKIIRGLGNKINRALIKRFFEGLKIEI